MSIISALPYNLTNGTTADATQVMANFNQIYNSVNSGAAESGINSSITQLTGLTTPLSVTQGGTGANVAGATAANNIGALAIASNLADLANAVTARTNLGVTASGSDTTYNYRANNLSDVANKSTARTNLGAIGRVNIQAFTSSGTYTPTTGMVYALVRLVGSGGGGGGGSNIGQAGVGSGGGAGCGAEAIFSAATIGASQAITIGAAGSGGSVGGNGGNGGTTSFGALLSAGGGSAGANSGAGGTTGGAGSSTSAGATVTYPGAPGNICYSLFTGGQSAGFGGTGGNSLFGGGGNAGGANGPYSGTNGSGFGSGGGGGSAQGNGNTPGTGGAGAPGFVEVIEFIAA